MGIQSLSKSAPVSTEKPVSSAPSTGRWEYLTMTYNYSYGATTYVVNGEKAIHLKNMPLHDALTQFGQSGWDLVSISEGIFVFKRQGIRQNGKENPTT